MVVLKHGCCGQQWRGLHGQLLVLLDVFTLYLQDPDRS